MTRAGVIRRAILELTDRVLFLNNKRPGYFHMGVSPTWGYILCLDLESDEITILS